jgi:hypothetical protein
MNMQPEMTLALTAWLTPRGTMWHHIRDPMAPFVSCRYADLSQIDLLWCQNGAIVEPWNSPSTWKAFAAS